MFRKRIFIPTARLSKVPKVCLGHYFERMQTWTDGCHEHAYEMFWRLSKLRATRKHYATKNEAYENPKTSSMLGVRF